MKTYSHLITLLVCVIYVPLAEAATPVKIMPLGDSLTSGYSVPTYLSGYRDRLYSKLVEAGYDPDFLGSQVDTQNPALPDPNHEGHGGYRIDQIDSGISGWLGAVADPDMILLIIGTNDFSQNNNPAGAPNRLNNLISKISSLRPNAKIFLGNLPLRTDSAALEADQSIYNAAIPGIVSDQVSLGRNVYFVDMHSSFSASGLSSDGVHPNPVGYDAMADVWTQAIMQIVSPPPPILINGSFEFGSLISATPYPRYQLNNWTSIGTPFGFPGNSVATATDGSRMVLFNGGSDIYTDILSQTFATTPGATYQVRFDLGIVVAAGKGERQQLLGVAVTGEGGGSLISQDVSLTGNEGLAQWTSRSYLFTATTATSTLAFTDKSGTLTSGVANFSDLMLDQVRVNVAHPNEAPVANNNSYSTGWNTTLVMAAPGVLDGDTDIDSQTLTAVIVTSPLHGSLILNPNGSFSYAPNNGFSGIDSFSYKANDGFLDSNPATVSIVVNPASALANGSFEFGALISTTPFPRYQLNSWTAAGSPFGFPGNAATTATEGSRMALFNGGSNIYTDTLSQTFGTTPGVTYQLHFDYGIVVATGKAPRQQLLGVAVTGEGGGSLFLQDLPLTGNEGTGQWTAGSYSFTATTATTTLVFTDRSGMLASGVADFSDLLLDNVRITSPINTAPTITDVTDKSTNEDAATSVLAFTIGDLETTALSLTVTSDSSNLLLVPLANIVLSGSGTNRTVTITPAANQSGTATITLTVSDGSMTASDAFVLTINPINDPPLAEDDGGVATPFLTVAEDSGASASITVLTNDSDLDLDSLTITAANSANGSVAIVSSGTALSFTPAASFNGATTISYTISDGNGGTSSATVFIMVTPVTDNYAEWLAEFGTTGNPGDDPDHDSIANAVEYAIGGDPKDPSDVDLLPSISLVSEIPDPYFLIGNYLRFTYRRTHLANNDPSTHIRAEWNESLTGPWTTADGSHGEVIVEVPNGVENGIDKVDVYVPCSPSGRLFGRLGVAIDAP